MDEEIIENHCTENEDLPVLFTSFALHFPAHVDGLSQDVGDNDEDIIDSNELGWE